MENYFHPIGGAIFRAEGARWATAKDRIQQFGKGQDSQSVSFTTALGLDANKGDKFVEKTRLNTVHGATMVRLQQTFRDIKVYDSLSTIEIDATSGQYTGDASGKIAVDIQDDITNQGPDLSEEDAISRAVSSSDIGIQTAITDKTAELQVRLDTNSKKAFWAYSVTFMAVTGNSVQQPQVVLNGDTGEVVEIHDDVLMT